MISFRTSKLRQTKNMIIYKASCDCGSSECDLIMELEKDNEIENMIYLTFYKRLCWSTYKSCDNWFTMIYERFKAAVKMIFTGYIEVDETFIFNGIKQIDTFIEALNEGKTRL